MLFSDDNDTRMSSWVDKNTKMFDQNDEKHKNPSYARQKKSRITVNMMNLGAGDQDEAGINTPPAAHLGIKNVKS